ncbi:hypothetical protein [Marinitoga aeolica]|uniref:Oligosaccharide repeat unit polymerase n=1 Tax=Marinitoga aeolica TaxID=2809031 RepID=A0ABY8PTU2_9BACT|nr:hypothetical protein [Marinitoga aeolica]WGS66025.1 oligosaccharide repeat unit polymerase [Marinitoga aeolica]
MGVDKISNKVFNFLIFGFFWLPVVFFGDDLIYISEIIIAFLFIMFIKTEKIEFKSYWYFLIPIILFFYRITFAPFAGAVLVAKEYILFFKQIEYFVILTVFYHFFQKNKYEESNLFNILNVLFITYAIYIFYDGISHLGQFHRAVIPFKKGVSSSLSGLFSSISIYFSYLNIINNRKKFLNIFFLLIGLGALILTFSRTSLLAMILVFSVFYIFEFIYSKNKKIIILSILVLLLILSTLSIVYNSLDYKYGLKSFDINGIIRMLKYDRSFYIRIHYIAKPAIEKDIGEDTFHTFINTLFGNIKNSQNIWDNQYLMLFNNFGLIGVFSYFLIYLNIYIMILKKYNNIFNKLMFLITTHIVISGITLESMTNIYVFLNIYYILIAYLIYQSGGCENGYSYYNKEYV